VAALQAPDGGHAARSRRGASPLHGAICRGESARRGEIVMEPLKGSPHLDGHHDPRAVPQPADQIADAFQPAVLGVQECMPYLRA
jgi:hypothetical protein